MKDKKRKKEIGNGDLLSASPKRTIIDISHNAAITHTVIMLFVVGIYISDARREGGSSLLGYRGRVLIGMLPLLSCFWELKKQYNAGLFNMIHASLIKKMPKKELAEPPIESKQTVIPLNRNAAFRQQQAAHRQFNKNIKKTHGICSRLYSKLLSMFSDCFSTSKNKSDAVLHDKLPKKLESSEIKDSGSQEIDKKIKNKSRNHRRRNLSKSFNQLNEQKISSIHAAENNQEAVVESKLTSSHSSTRTILAETSSDNDSEDKAENNQEAVAESNATSSHSSIEPAQPISSSSSNIAITPASLENKDNQQDAALHQILGGIHNIEEKINSLKQNISRIEQDPNYAISSEKAEKRKSLTNIELQQAIEALELKYEGLQKQIESSQSLQNNELADKKSDIPSVNNEKNEGENEIFKKTVLELVTSAQHLVTIATDIDPLAKHRRLGGETQADNVRRLGNTIIHFFIKNPQFKIPPLANSALPPQQLPTRNMF